MQPSDSLVPLGRRSGRPSPTAYLGAETLSFPSRRCPRHPDATPETFLPRLPTRRLCPEERQGPPRCLGHPLRACRALRPRRVRRAPRPATGAPAVAFRSSETLSTRNAFNFGALPLTAHSLACLRFAQSVTVSGARLATGRAGSPLAGRVSHPLDDEQGFMVSSHTPILLDQPCLVAPKARIHTASTDVGCAVLRTYRGLRAYTKYIGVKMLSRLDSTIAVAHMFTCLETRTAPPGTTQSASRSCNVRSVATRPARAHSTICRRASRAWRKFLHVIRDSPAPA